MPRRRPEPADFYRCACGFTVTAAERDWVRRWVAHADVCPRYWGPWR